VHDAEPVVLRHTKLRSDFFRTPVPNDFVTYGLFRVRRPEDTIESTRIG